MKTIKKEIIDMRNEDYTRLEISYLMGLSINQIQHIINHKAAPHIKLICFCCKNIFSRTRIKKTEYNFCGKCFKKYFIRPTGTSLEGREYTREIVRIRDGHKCIKCNKEWKFGTRRFDVHHKDDLTGSKTQSYDKQEEIDQLETLCHKCHLSLPQSIRRMGSNKEENPEYKIRMDRAIAEYLRGGQGIRKVALKYGITYTSLRKWVI